MTTVTGDKVKINQAIEKYASKTVESLERYATKSERATLAAEVMLRRVDRAHGNKYEATVTLHVGKRIMTATDSTLNVFAALDIVRAKLAAQLQ